MRERSIKAGGGENTFTDEVTYSATRNYLFSQLSHQLASILGSTLYVAEQIS